jgi:hypothetical protein
MDRKEFLRKAGALGAATGAAVLLGDLGPCCATAQTPSPAPATPCDRRLEFIEPWVKRLMEVVDSRLDAPARQEFMETCGRTCFAARHGARPAKPEPNALEELIAALKKWTGEEGLRREGNTIHFAYGKPSGADRVRCLCPVVETGPAGLSPTYCQCSVGYVKEMFERAAGKPVQVELTESLKRGGQACRFVIRV